MNAPASRPRRQAVRVSWRSSRPVLCMPKPKRPKTRGDCAGGVRPCPWASCRYHVAQVRSGCKGAALPMGQVPNIAEWAQTCVLDVADKGGVPLAEVGDVLGVTRERVRQLEVGAFTLFERRMGRKLEGFVDLPSPEDDPNQLIIDWRHGGLSVRRIMRLLTKAGHAGWSAAAVTGVLLSAGFTLSKGSGSAARAMARCTKWLKARADEWHTTTTIAEALDLEPSYITRLTRELRKQGKVEHRRCAHYRKLFEYRWVGGDQ